MYEHTRLYTSYTCSYTALHLAASKGYVELVEFLLEHRADVNVTDRMGFSPLVDALRHDQSAGDMPHSCVYHDSFMPEMRHT